jgi:hypothetical protein
MKRATEADFDIKLSEAGVTAIFKPTNSHYSFNRLVEPRDVAQYGPLSPDARVRHAGPTGDTGDYDSRQVQQMAFVLASLAAKRTAR